MERVPDPLLHRPPRNQKRRMKHRIQRQNTQQQNNRLGDINQRTHRFYSSTSQRFYSDPLGVSSSGLRFVTSGVQKVRRVTVGRASCRVRKRASSRIRKDLLQWKLEETRNLERERERRIIFTGLD